MESITKGDKLEGLYPIKQLSSDINIELLLSGSLKFVTNKGRTIALIKPKE